MLKNKFFAQCAINDLYHNERGLFGRRISVSRSEDIKYWEYSKELFLCLIEDHYRDSVRRRQHGWLFGDGNWGDFYKKYDR